MPIEEDPVVASYLEAVVLVVASYLEVEVLSFQVVVPYLEPFLEVVVLSYLGVEASFLEVVVLEVASFLEEVVLSLEGLVQALGDRLLEVLEFHVLVVAFDQVLDHQLLVLVHSNQEVLMSSEELQYRDHLVFLYLVQQLHHRLLLSFLCPLQVVGLLPKAK